MLVLTTGNGVMLGSKPRNVVAASDAINSARHKVKQKVVKLYSHAAGPRNLPHIQNMTHNGGFARHIAQSGRHISTLNGPLSSVLGAAAAMRSAREPLHVESVLSGPASMKHAGAG